MKYELYEVGGKIRDEVLGLQSKDVDYSVVIESKKNINTVFFEFVKQIQSEGFEVFLETPDCFTVRAKFPKNHKYSGVADFVLARKEKYYPENSRKPVSVLGTLEDDLKRRDFTVNALAKGPDGKIIDLFNGVKDLHDGILRTTGDTAVSFNDDPLRILRAIRFSITKGLEFSDSILDTLKFYDSNRLTIVSTERIREELYKCFKHDTKMTIMYLTILQELNNGLYEAMLPDELWLEPTMKK